MEQRLAKFSTKQKRVDFVKPPAEERFSKIYRWQIAKRIFILFAVVAVLLSLWYLLSSIVIKPIKEIFQEEFGKEGQVVQFEDPEVLRQKSNMSHVFSNALFEMLHNRTGSGDGTRDNDYQDA